ncbi:MerR family transcriptional regulator [Leptolinea tardivitalis]|uniref:MerR family transcriptional regulator n=1 Tax=Leptolinea tardivitalis TaxID=229920 RepID=A0A0P6WSR9_9CHLR|nr:MerR family transcriptional regulator [Leptolinea tardivitalis]KPL73279.1 MerR family transcriptional regulator [Leptolinea tardivitalis]GAP21401.1 predicted transcriptional regulator [Leptolinea tardivitalis]
MKDENKSAKKKIPMRELEKLTNFTRATINFYIREGILPFPQKSARNMAYYDDEFIRKLERVRLLKRSGFSLLEIKQLMNDEKEPAPEIVLNVLNRINTLLPYESNESTVTLEQITGIGLDKDLVKDFVNLKIISPSADDPNLFPSYCLTICRFVKYFLDAGIPLAVAHEVVQKLVEITRIEKTAFDLYIRQPMMIENAPVEEQTRAVQNCLENINSLLPLIHLQLLKQTAESLLKGN